MADSTPMSQLNLPTELMRQLEADAHARKLDVPAYIAFLRHLASARGDGRAKEAARFMIQKHSDSLKKLAT